MVLCWRAVRGFSAMALLSAALICTGCGVKSSAITPTTPPCTVVTDPSVTPILLTLTDDATSNGLVSFYANIAEVQITPRNGCASTLYQSTSTYEITHLAGTSRYLTMTGLGQSSYINIIVNLTNPFITYIGATGATVTEAFPSVTATAQINFASLLTVDTTPLEITLDFNLEKSVVLDPTTGAMTLTPTFTATALPIAATSPDLGTGLLETVLGSVTKYTGSALSLTSDVTQTTIGCNLTGATTVVNDGSTTGFPQGSLVRVDMAAQRDSSIDCVRIEAVNSAIDAYAVAGTLNSYRGGISPYQFTLAMQEGTGAGVSPNFIGHGINVNFDSPAATFAVDWDGMDQTNLGFTPLFNDATFFPAQYVEASSSLPLTTTGNDVGPVPGSLITVAAMNAQRVTLRKQQEDGTPSSVVTNSNGVTTFILTLDPSTVFAQYTALPVEPTGFVPTINVIVPASVTINGSLTVPIAGAPVGSLPYVDVRGLLFLNGASYTLVAQRVTATLPPVQPVSSSL